MRFRLGLTAPVAMAVFLVALVACGDDDTASGPSAPGINTPNIQATVSALAQSQSQSLTPTPAPESARQDLIAFAEGHQATSVDWDSFHEGMDKWRDGVSVCTPAAVVSALDNFAGQALGLAQTARGIHRLPDLETLAVQLTAAVESEAAACEALSDEWTAENGPSGAAGLFQQLASARAAAELERASVSRALLARQNSADEDSRDLIEVFSSNMATLNLDWDQFHRAYDAFRTEVIDPEDETAESGLAGLLIQFGAIVDKIRKLPGTSLTRDIAGRLADAAEGEQLLLRRLLSPDGALAENVPVLPENLVIIETGNGGAGLSGLTLSEATVFVVFDTHVASVNRLRRSLRNEFDDARASLSENGQVNVSVLLFQVRSLGLGWDDFHDGYDDWRRTNGGCDQRLALGHIGTRDRWSATGSRRARTGGGCLPARDLARAGP